MSKKDEYQIEDILYHLKEVRENSKDIEDYTDTMKKYDTQALLDEILKKEPEAELLQQEQQKQLQDEAQADILLKQHEAQVQQQAISEFSKELIDNEQNLQRLKQQEAEEKEEIRQIMQSTSHLKYMALRKNREKQIKNFRLKPLFSMTQPIEVHEETKREYTKEVQTSTMKKNSTLIKEYIPGQTPTDDVPVVEESQQDTPLSMKHIQEWKKHAGQEQTDGAQSEEQPEEYTVPVQTKQAKTAIQSLKRTVQVKLGVLSGLFLFSIGLSCLDKLPVRNPFVILDPRQNPLPYCVAQLSCLIFACGICFDLLLDGLKHLFKRNPGRNSLYSITMLVMCFFNGFILSAPERINHQFVYLYVPFLIIVLISVMVGKLIAFRRIEINFRFVSGSSEKYSVTIMNQQNLADELTKNALNDYPCLIYNKKTPFLSDFFNESFSEDTSDRIAKTVLPLVCGIALIVAMVALMIGFDIFVALTAFTGILIIGSGVIPLVMVNYPLYTASKDLSRLGCAVLGYNAVDNFGDVNSIIIHADTLFEPENVILYGIKTFTNMAIDRAILDATSVLYETHSILSGVFLNIINGRKDFLQPVDTVIYEDGMGISAWMKDRRVLIGSRELMINHNIDVPTRNYEQQNISSGEDKNIVYLSTGGELSAAFVFGLKHNEDVRDILIDLYNNDVTCIVKTVDPFLTQKQLADVYAIPERAFKIIPSVLHKEVNDISYTKEHVSGSVSNNGTFSAYVYSALYAKRLIKPIQLGVMIHFFSIGVGILLFTAFTILNGLNQLTNFTLCIYEVISFVVCIALQRMTKL